MNYMLGLPKDDYVYAGVLIPSVRSMNYIIYMKKWAYVNAVRVLIPSVRSMNYI